MLPRLLAAYRKYGSRAAGWLVPANHRCSKGAVVLTTKKGSPVVSNSTANSQGIGLDSVGVGRMVLASISTRNPNADNGMIAKAKITA